MAEVASRAFTPSRIPRTHVQERMSAAYISAVAARAGCSCTPTPAGGDYGADFYLQKVAKVQGAFGPVSPLVTLQAKSTITAEVSESHLAYSVEGKAYNKIVRANEDSIPTALVVFRMPRKTDLWLSQDEHELKLLHCAYWKFLKGDTIANDSSKKIRIPIGQTFDPGSIDSIFDISKKVRLGTF